MATTPRGYVFVSREQIKCNIAMNVKKYRQLAGITQEQLAVDIDVTTDFIKKLENKMGEVGCENYTLYKIAKVLNTSIDNFFE